jgi:hypothetical protein
METIMETRKRWGFFFFILFALYVLVENSKKPKITGTGKTFRPYGCKDSLNEIKELVGNKGDIYTTETVVSSTFDDGSVIYASCLSSGTFNIKSSMRSTWEVK